MGVGEGQGDCQSEGQGVGDWCHLRSLESETVVGGYLELRGLHPLEWKYMIFDDFWI